MKRAASILLSVLLVILLTVPSFASSSFRSTAPVLSRLLRLDLFSFLQWDMRMIRMPLVWDSGPTGSGVRIGIIDSGISAKTRDLDPEQTAADTALLLPGLSVLPGTTGSVSLESPRMQC